MTMTKNYQELIPGRIYIGGADDLSVALENEKIDVAYDLRAEAGESVFENHKHTPIVDDAANQDESIRHAVEEIVTSYNEGKNIYFHCQGGSNRTGTVAIGTLLSLELAKSMDDAEQQAKSARPKINVKPEMKEALARLYK